MKRKSVEYYLKSVDRRWKKEVSQARGKVLILSPYLTSKTAELVLENLDSIENCEIYTVFSINNFVSGASSLRTIKSLFKVGFKLYHLPRLHAKIIIGSQSFVSIGSQNLTRNGVRNKEASVVICHPQEVAKIEKSLEAWISQDQLISNAMIDEVEKNLLTLRRKFCSLQREANNLESAIWENEEKRLEEARLVKEAEERRQVEERNRIEEEKIKKEAEEKMKNQKEEQWREKVNTIRARIGQLAEYEKVELSLAKEFIRTCAYWEHPRWGGIYPAPKDANRIDGSQENWWIKFGGNYFLVSKAICQCKQTLLEFLDSAAPVNAISITELENQLQLNVRQAVANSEKYEYSGLYPLDGDYMKFGNHLIKISEFINLLLKKVQLYILFT